MPGCAAVGCNNRSEKGYIMKCFPRDPKLRKIWQERVARADWEPSNNSFLCHVHFEPQEWSITQSGRIRLKKNAIPSIFTITSTRKSPKKRTKIIHIKEENVSQSEYSAEYMENDTEYSSAEHLEEKDSDFQDVDEPSMQSTECEFKYFPESVEEEEEEEEEEDEEEEEEEEEEAEAETETETETEAEAEEKEREKEKEVSINSNVQRRNIAMIGEDNLADISGLVKQDNLEVQVNDNKQEIGVSLMINKSETIQIPAANVKEEIKLEVMDRNTFEDSYDEIEEKLKQICDGGSTEDEDCKNEGGKKLTVKNHKEDKDVQAIDRSCDFNTYECKGAMSVNKDHNSSTKNETGHMLTDKEENVEIIFGAESGDEKMSVSQVTSKINKVDGNSLEYDEIISIKDEKKIFNEDIEENFTKDEVHVIPNIRAAMKRKRRTRKEIMKSIKKSIRSTSNRDVNSSSNSEMSDSIEKETEVRNESSMSLQEVSDISKKNDTEMETARFIIKVTGDPDDVTEIIEELSSNTIGTHVSKKFNTLYKNEENDAFVTSIITVLSPKNSKEIIYSDFSSPLMKDDYVTLNKKELMANQSPSEDRDFESLDSARNSKKCHSCFRHTGSDKEDKNQIGTNSTLYNCIHSAQSSQEHNTGCCISPDCGDLLVRIQIQEDVIAKLTDQLIIYKELENSMRYKNTGYDIQTKEAETGSRINTRSSNMQSSVMTKKILESKQRLIEDLSNRVNYFEEMNKKLMKTVTLESQQKRKLEGQIKQKDNRIKELNWKLEKASKYLERAEKNTNTYRRKMLNMQTIMRRRKLLDEKMSKFNELLIDSSKQEYSEKALAMASDVRKTCGRNGYDKLLSYGFPLPPLPALRKGVLNEDFTDHNKSDMDKGRNSSTKLCIKAENVQDVNNESEMDEKDSELPDSMAKATEYDAAETVTGTVQDIFDENNDGDDFSTNELREHFILQLNAVM